MGLVQENGNVFATLAFSEANLAVSQTATAIPVVGADANSYGTITKGYIVGYSFEKSAAHSAGSLDFDITVNGTSVKTLAADTVSIEGLIPVPDLPFAAGDAIGVTYTSDENLLATTVDVVVQIVIVYTEFSV